MRRVMSFLLAMFVSITVLGTTKARASNEIYYDGAWHTYTGNFFQLKLDNELLKCEVPPIVFNDYSVVPARDVFEKLGAEVVWNGQREQVIINYKTTNIILYINNKMAYKNGRADLMPIAPKIINGKTMIPVRYVSESIGFDVGFDSKTDTISIQTGKKQVETPKPTPTPELTVTLNSYKCNVSEKGVSAVFTLSQKDVKYSAFALTAPDRIVVDITNAKMGASIRNQELESEIVTAVRIGQQTEALRIVFDLPESQKYNVTLSGKTLKVVIGDGAEDVKTDLEPPDATEPEEELPVIEIEPSRSITIDPGHGGSDPGACFIEEDGTIWKETDINLAISLKVRDILKKHGVRVVMTRTTEKDVVRKTRPELANSEKTALFISIHTNSVAENDVANGIETWGSLESSRPLAGVTDKSFAENVQKAVIKKTSAHDRGIKDSVDLTVLKYSVMPSVLVEVGFITNQTERENLFSESYRNKLAQGIAQGILDTFDDMGV